jgi:uncharacterized protein with PQ loop repeat
MDAAQFLAPIVGTFGVMMSISPLLQVARVVRRGSSDDIAVLPLVVVVIGCALWLSYGLASNEPTLVVANVVGTMVNIGVLTTVLRFRSTRRVRLQAGPAVAEPVAA